MLKREFNQSNTRPTKVGLVFLFFKLFSLVFLTFVLEYSSPCQAQWKQLLNLGEFGGTLSFSCIYFIDLPGPPRIGFLGTNLQLYGDSLASLIYKTTDGGMSWHIVNIDFACNDVNDITFKDSLIGWVATGEGGCYKTTDGGETWFNVTIPPPGYGSGIATGVYYDQGSGGLFLSTFASDAPVYYGQDELSWDEGATWQPFAYVGNEESGGFAFSSGDTGLMAWNDLYPASWWRTTDGGQSWTTLSIDSMCWQPLAIPETQTYFANTPYGTILRTDDAGVTWDSIYSFPPQYSLNSGEYIYEPNGSISSGCIRGTLDSLYVMVCSGCYLSTDQGLSWKSLCSPPILREPVQRFYVKSNRIYIIANEDTTGNSTPSLWMLDMDSLNTVVLSSSVQLGNGLKQETIYSGDTVQVYYLSDSGLGSEIGSDSISISISFDTNSLSLVHFELDSGWSIKDSSYSNGTYHLLLVSSDSLGLDSSAVILRADFASYLSSTPQSKVYLDSVHFYGRRLNCDCAVASVTGADSVEIDFQGCGDSLLLAAMSGKPLFTIESIQPNPAANLLQVNFSNPTSAAISYQIIDALGQTRLNGMTLGAALSLDVSSLPAGIYFIRAISENGYSVSSKLAIVR